MRYAVAVLVVLAACAPNNPSTPEPDAGAHAAVCGDGVKDASEACDDGNLASGDGCSAVCAIEAAPCGDGVLGAGETCDDGNTADGDGCSALCRVEPSHLCAGEPSHCITFCAQLSGAKPVVAEPENQPFARGSHVSLDTGAAPAGSTIHWYVFGRGIHIVEAGTGSHVELDVVASPTVVATVAVDDTIGCMRTDVTQTPLAVRQPEYSVNQPFPHFTAPSVDGNQFSTESLAGKFFVLDFCAVTCIYCRENIAPAVENIRVALGTINLQVEWISVLMNGPDQQPSTQADAEWWREHYRVGDGVVLHADGTFDSAVWDAFNNFGARGYPSFVFVDSNGKIFAIPDEVIFSQEIVDVVANYVGATPPAVGEILPFSDGLRATNVDVDITGQARVSEHLKLNDRGVVRIDGLAPNVDYSPFPEITPAANRETGREGWTIGLSFLGDPPPDAEISLRFWGMNWMDGHTRHIAPDFAGATVSVDYDGPTPGSADVGPVDITIESRAIVVHTFSRAMAVIPEGHTFAGFTIHAENLLDRLP